MLHYILTILLSQASSNAAPPAVELPPVNVVSTRTELDRTTDSARTTIDYEAINLEAPKHPHEILDRVPGAWVSLGSGQEHLTAIRSPVLTGAGACGAFMVLEDGVPTRPAGFCNVNQLFELNIAQASQIDVLRGPGTVAHGSNAMHGAIEITTPGTTDKKPNELSLEVGSDDYKRGLFSAAGEHMAVQLNVTDAGSFRDDEHFQHGLFNWQMEHTIAGYTGRTSLAYANLDQDTAGFILGKNAFRDRHLRVENLNPDAFRKAWALRLSSRWNGLTSKADDLEFIPYIRSSQMDFLQHFLPGTPLEQNSQRSAGLLFTWSRPGFLTAGLDIEMAEGSLSEYQKTAIETGSNFLRETRPQGLHYDYNAKSSTLALWAQLQKELKPGLTITAGLRGEYLSYDYDNKMLDGNTRDDGSECLFGGCLYMRPSDRSDNFSNLSPELGVSMKLGQNALLYVRTARGYRAPQATELYRLQSGQSVADLKPETLDSVEIGLNGSLDTIEFDVSLYAMRKQNFIFRDANGFNISHGKTRHLGLEALLHWQISDSFRISANLSRAQHTYEFSHNLARGEVIVAGNEIDTAPRWLGAWRARWHQQNHEIEAEWVYQGGYFLDAENAHRYSGHQLMNLRGSMMLGSQHSLSLRLSNVFNTHYAERADFAFGNYRYFPGAGRSVSVQWHYLY